MARAGSGIRCPFLLFICIIGLLAGPAAAGNYDGEIAFSMSCKRAKGGTWGNSYDAEVVNGKFSDRRSFKKGEPGCRNTVCWTAWEGTIRDDGSFRINIQENAYDQVSSYVSRWMLTGKFETLDTGTAKVVVLPRDWQSKCENVTITLVDPAPESLAARSADKPTVEAKAAPTPPPAASKDYGSSLRDAKLLLRKVEAYAKSSGTVPNVIAVAEVSSKLRTAVKAFESRSGDSGLGAQLETSNSELSKLMATDTNFAAFARTWEEAKKQADAQSAIVLKARAKELQELLVQQVSRDVMSEENEKLVPLIRALEQLGPDPGFEQLESTITAAETAVKAAGLRPDKKPAGPPDAQIAATPAPAPIDVTQAPDIKSQKRVALVIGNSAYQNTVELPNPRNDARAISAQLLDLGFEVVDGEDLDKAGMEKSIRQFIGKVPGSDVALFFYAGHGMQVAGKNYLIPIDAKLEDASAVDFETIDADRVLGYMGEENRVAIALLDACRDNPLSRQFARSLGASRSASVGKGLAMPATLGGGMLIGFATAPGDVALDGEGGNSPFTKALLKYLPERGLEIQQLMTKVKAEVYAATNKQQSPWHNSDLRKEFYLKP